MDSDTNDIASNGFGNCLTRDGQGVATANLPMAGFKHTGVANGTASTDYAAFGQVPAKIVHRSFAVNGTYTPSATLRFCIAEGWGGGGGGGGAAASATSIAGGGGGGAGAYGKVALTAAQVGAGLAVTIGPAGNAGPLGNNPGGNGGTTSLGAFLVVPGGSGGAGAPAGSTGAGGGPGLASGVTGDIAITGGSGFAGSSASITTVQLLSGHGGGSPHIGQPTPGVSGSAAATTGLTGGQNGCGGSGGQSAGSGTGAAGGAGVVGLIIVTEFIS